MTDVADAADEAAGKQDYWVDLAVGVEAETPEEAIAQFVEGIVQGNVRNWAYGVRDQSGRLVGVYDGFGVPILREDLDEAPDEHDEHDEHDEQEGEAGAGDGEDEQLLSLATQLNQQQPGD